MVDKLYLAWIGMNETETPSGESRLWDSMNTEILNYVCPYGTYRS